MSPEEQVRDYHLIKRFENHVIETELESKSWKVKSPQEGFYWFVVTWTKPGVLILSGDCGTMVVRDYYAMNESWEAAAAWMYGSSFDYVMKKTDIKKVFDLDGTIDNFVEILYDARCDDLDDCIYCEEFTKRMNTLSEVYDFYFYQGDTGKKELAEDLKCLIEDTEEEAYRLAEILNDEPWELVATKYPYQYENRYACLQTWAKLVLQK